MKTKSFKSVDEARIFIVKQQTKYKFKLKSSYWNLKNKYVIEYDILPLN